MKRNGMSDSCRLLQVICILFLLPLSAATVMAGACDLYPIALSADSLDGLAPNQEIANVLNGTQPGNFGWLTWAGSPSTKTLIASLTPDGDSDTYINPDNDTDHEISVGDWVQGKPGVSNSKDVRNALNALTQTDIIVPVWDDVRGEGAHADYWVAGYARIRLIGYNLSGKQNKISALFLGYTSCQEGNAPPIVDAGGDMTITLPDSAMLQGTATDDGLPAGSLTVAWSMVSGPGTVTFADGNAAVTEASFSEAGEYVLRLMADDSELTASDDVVITVNSANTPPTADDKSATTDEDTPVSITLTGSDAEGDSLTFAVAITPSYGLLAGTPPNLTYTPINDYNGTDSFTYTANDGELESEQATVSITINPVNDAPEANTMSYTNHEDTLLVMELTGADIDGDVLTFSVVDNPLHGTLSGPATNLIYTPDANYSGQDSFTFIVNDGTADSAVVTNYLLILAVNDAPVANSQNVSTDEDAAIAIILTGSDVDGDSLSYSILTMPVHGVLAGTAPNLTYTPDANYNGADSFTFEVNDGNVASASAEIAITINPVNDGPVAGAQSLSVAEDAALAITLSAFDIDGDPLSYLVVVPPANGTLSGTAPNLTYTPNADFNGTDSFTFEAADGSASGSAVIEITVTPVNDAPTADDQSVSTDEDTVVPIILTGSDIDGDAISYAVIGTPSHGVLGGTAPNLTYTPDANYNGTDTFTFEVSDGTEISAPATVSLTVNPVNDTPVADAQTVATNEDNALIITLSGSDIDGDVLSYTVVADSTHGVLSRTAPNLTYTPAENYNGTDAFTFEVSDGTASASATVDITISPVNDAPVADSQTAVTDEDSAVSITLTGSDVDADSLTYAVVVSPLNGTLSGTAPNLIYTPNENYNGSDSFTFEASDGTLVSSAATVTIAINPVNDTPTADDQSVVTEEDVSLSITLTGSDIDGDALSYAVVAAPLHGTLEGTAPDLTYTPNADYNGSDSFTFTVNDGTESSSAATVSITIHPVNDAPVADAQSVETDEDTALGVTLTGSDVDGDSLVISVSVMPLHGTLSGTAPDLTYTPNADYNGPDSFAFEVSDGVEVSSSAVVTITVNPVNDAPMADGQSVATDEDTALAIAITGADIDGDTLSYTVVDAPVNGVLSGTAPNLTYTPNENFNGADSLSFKVSDGSLESAIATVNITVNPVNDAPSADDQTVATDEDTAMTITLTGSDVDGDALSYAIAVAPIHGILSGTAPDLIYTPSENFNGTDSFTFETSDGALSSSPATVSITIQPVNDAPVAVDQSVITDEDSAASVTLTGSDIDGDSLSYAVLDAPLNGTLSGTAPDLTYTPNADFHGADSFTFEVNDGTVSSAPATVTITVNSVNDAPVANAGEDQLIDEGTNTVLNGSATDDNTPEGSTLSYAWSQLSGSGTASFSDANDPAATVSFTVPGVYVLQLSVSDSELSDTDEISITVNDAPVVNAGTDQIADYPGPVSIVGTVSDDGVPSTELSTAWMQVSGPGAALFEDVQAVSTSVRFTLPGEYVLRLNVTDSRLLGVDDVNFSVRPAGPNAAPVVNAGTDQTVGLTGKIVLEGSVSDDGLLYGSEMIVEWSAISGPGTVSFNDASDPAAVATVDQSGTYVLRLTANDGELTASDEVEVTVFLGNLPPVVNAGADITVSETPALLSGNVSDDGLPAGESLTVMWTQISGPGTASFNNAAQANTTVSFSEGGSYVLRLTASDSEYSASDEISVNVTGNQPPVADAGPDQILELTIPVPPSETNTPPEPPAMADRWIYDLAQPGLTGLVIDASGVEAGRHGICAAGVDVYVGGIFNYANSVEVQGLGRWNCDWSALYDPRPLNPADTNSLPIGFIRRGSKVNPVDARGEYVYVGGAFLKDLNNDGSGEPLALWDGSGWEYWFDRHLTWSTIAIWDIEAASDAVYVVGSFKYQLTNDLYGFTPVPGLPEISSIAKWNGSEWEAMGQGITNRTQIQYPATVQTVAVAPNGDVFAGGNFVMDTPWGAASNIVWWNGTEWKPIGKGPNGVVNDIAIDDAGKMYVAGRFNIAGGIPANNVAKVVFNPDSQTWVWSSLGTGSSNGIPSLLVEALAIRGNDLYAGGLFTMAGGRSAQRVARWDGSGWWPLGSASVNGVNNWVYSLASGPDGIYVGGVFTTAAGQPAGGIALWGVPKRPTLECPEDVLVNNAPPTGSEVVLTAYPGHPCGIPLTVTWNVDGGAVEQTNELPAGTTAPNTAVSFTGTFVPGVHTVEVTVNDGITPPLTCSVTVTILSPATTILYGSVTDDGLPAGITNAQWTLVSGPAAVSFGTPDNPVTSASFIEVGTYILRLTGDDTLLNDWDEVMVIVGAEGDANNPPSVDAGANRNVLLSDTVSLTGTVSDDGLPAPLQTLWSVISGPGTVTFGDASQPVTTATFSEAGTYVLRLTADDTELSFSDEVTIVVSAQVNEPPVVSTGDDMSLMLAEDGYVRTSLSTSAEDDGLPIGVLDVNWSKASGPGNVLFSSQDGIYKAMFNTAGTYVLRLTADDSQLSAYDEITVVVYDYASEPVVDVSALNELGVITAPTAITGTIDSSIPIEWELQYRIEDSTWSSEAGWITITSGTSAVSGEFATFDPTLLLNGLYEVRVVVEDEIGRITVSEVVAVVIEGNMKVGQFTMSFKDLSVPVSGIPVEVVRTYDSRAGLAERKGDFGMGWTMSLTDIRLQKSRPLGQRWYQEITGFSPFGLSIYEMGTRRDLIVSIAMPDNEVYRFRAIFDPDRQIGVPILSGVVRFEPMPGTHGTLEAVGGSTVRVMGDVPYADPSGPILYAGYVELLDNDTFFEYNPRQFRFTSQEGTVFVIDEDEGLQSVTDLNGNEVVYNENGIFHSSGESVQFIRDAEGRIAQIVDPAGYVLEYGYDANGDLVSFTDRTTNATTFTYTDHLLEDIYDPRGVRAIRSEYDDAGRLIRQTDADGNPIEMTHDIPNRIETIQDRLGNVTVHEYDERGNVVETTDAMGGVTTYTYDTLDNQLTKTDPLGHTTTWTYDAFDNQTSETDSIGNTTETSYNQNRQPTSIADAKGFATVFGYDQYGGLTNMVDAAGNVTVFKYDARGNMIAQTDALGNVTSNSYDSLGRVVERTDALGVKTTYTYDANGNELTRSVTRTTFSGPEIVTTSNVYDNENRLIRVIHPDGSFEETRYNEAGKEIAKIDELGRITQMVYNDRGDLIQTIYPDGGIVGVGYDAEGRKVAETNQMGYVTEYEYDALGRLLFTYHPDGAVEETVYDAAGRAIQTIDALGNSTFYGYEEGCTCAGRRTSVTNALGQAMNYAYDENGNMVEFTDDYGRTTEYVYDELNRRTQVNFPDGTSQSSAYDALGRRISETDQAGIITSYGYDELSRLTSVTNAIGGVTRYAYDEMGNQTAQIDANGHITRYEYDSRGNRTKRILPEGQIETVTFDAARNMETRTDFNGKVTTFTYDAMNRLTAKIPDASFGASAIRYSYDLRGLRTNMVDASGTTAWQYDERGRKTEKASPVGTLTYGYDLQGNLGSTHSSNPNGTDVTYQYDELNRIRNVINPATGLTQYNYDNVGNLQNYIYPNGVSHAYEYDALNRLTNMVVNKLLNPIESYAYTLAQTGHRMGVQEGNGRQVSYQYDNLYRLTKETVIGASVSGAIDYALDPVGNRISMDSSIIGIPTATYSYDDNDRLGSDTYDDNGNTTASDKGTDEYNFENRLIRRNTAAETVSIVYDGDGNRVSKTVDPADPLLDACEVRYLVDDNNPTGYAQVLEELTEYAGTFSVDRVYTYGHDLVSQRRWNLSEWITSYYGYDGHGNVRLLTDSSGNITDRYDYDAFGNIIAQSGSTPNHYLYCGEQYDPVLEMYFLRARYMDAVRGRFWTMDEYEGLRSDPPSLHKYLYVGADPINRVDPSGEFSLIELNIVQKIQYNLRAAFYGPIAIISQKVYLGMARLVNAFSLRFSDTISSYSRSYYESRLLMQEIIRTGSIAKDPGGVITAVRYMAAGSLNGSPGVYELVIDLKTRTVLHFLFRSL